MVDATFRQAVDRLHQVEELLAVVDPKWEDVLLAEYQAAMAHVRACLWRHGHPRVDEVRFPWYEAAREAAKVAVLRRLGAA